MSIFNVLSLMGGLSLFLFGMGVMGDGLEKQAGGALNSILQKLTSNPLKGFLLGMAVTAVIQSSSATTVMVVGFVNSGIMQLGQAIGIIMGANVGTTVTAWILSLTGIEGDSLFMQLLKPSFFTPVLALFGAALYLFGKSGRKKDVGTILLGFAVLMYGMDSMSAAVKPLQNVPEFANILLLFSNPILGVLAGAFITAVIQSSSASVGILQALSATGSITYSSAVPIVLGQNIGTCVTAMLSSIGTNKNARRAAIVHLYFNILGTTIFLVLFYGLHAVVRFHFIDDQATAFGIAIVHTTFNLVSTAVLLPFCKVLEKLAYLTIPEEKGEKEKFQLLDDRLLLTPAVAISQSKAHCFEMAGIAKDITYSAMDLVGNYAEAGAETVSRGEKTVDKYEDKLGSYLVKLNGMSLAVEDSRDVSLVLNTIGEFERISDHAVNIMEVARELDEKKITFSGEGTRELAVITDAVREILRLSVEAFTEGDVEKAKEVEPLEQVIDDLRNTLKNRHIRRLQEGVCTIESGFIFVDLLTNYERIADHCSNIAICVIELSHGTMEPHEYLQGIRRDPGERFASRYQKLRAKYAV